MSGVDAGSPVPEEFDDDGTPLIKVLVEYLDGGVECSERVWPDRSVAISTRSETALGSSTS